MILIFGIPSESPVKLLTDACDAKGIPYVLFNQRNQARWKLKINYSNYNKSLLSNGEETFLISDFTGIYLRTMDHKQVPEYATCKRKDKIDELYRQLFSLLDKPLQPIVTNSPSPMMSNNSKPYQAMIITQYGLDTPATCITSNLQEAQAFIKKYKRVIYKSISGFRSIVKQVDELSFQELAKIKYCPVQFQECVIGTNVRVHVVGNKTIATKINSDAVDYRYAKNENKSTELEPMELDTDLSKKCIDLANALELPFSGIDLMFTKDGRTICFEVNPSPGYSYYESHTGQAISYALADYLAQNKN